MKLHKLPHKKLVVTVLIAIAMVVVGWLGYLWYKSATVNYAQEVARPIEEALVKAGGIKCKSTGDAGRGVDNRRPWLQDFYYVPVQQQQAEKLIYDVTGENGYKLKHASQDSKGPINVADEFIGMWYYDNTSKVSPYTELQSGNVELAIIVDDTGTGYRCSEPIPDDATLIGVDIKLPNYK